MKFPILFLLLALHSVAFAQKEKNYLAQVRLNGKCGFINASGHEVVPLIYDDAGSWGNGLVPVNIGKYVPSYDPPVIEYIPDKMEANDSVENKEKEIAIVEIKEEKGKWGYCDVSGKLVIPVQFTNTSFFNEGMAAVEINDKWGFIDTKGKIIVQPVYDMVGYYSQGLAPVVKNESHGYINLKGEEVIPLQYAGASAFENGYTIVSEKYASTNNNRTSIGRIINLKGEMITDAKYNIDLILSNGLASFTLTHAKFEESFLFGLINMKGEVVAQPIYREISDFNDGLAKVMVYKLDKVFDEYYPNYGYINAKGKEIITPSLAKAEDFSYGKAVVARFDDKDDGELDHALINTKGKIILDYNWRQLILLDNKHLLASIKNEYEPLVINTRGEKKLSFQGKGIKSLGNGLFVITNINEEPISFIGLDKKITIDLSQNKKRRFVFYQSGLIHFRYLPSSYEESYIIKLGLIDLKGNVIFEPKYNEILNFEPTGSPE